jgi:phosphate transport system substrate-binding protein
MRGVWWLLATLALIPAGCASSANTVTLKGCGATFPASLYKRWFLEFHTAHPEVRTNYQAIGSGAGVRQFSEGLVHFGGTDEALSAKKLAEAAKRLQEREGGEAPELIQIPLTAGAVAVCYNLPDSPKLRLTRKALAGIVLGEIEDWDDPAILACNPGVELPSIKITFIRRAESSGTTFNFTNHLNAIDGRWTKKAGGPGVGKSVQWPAGIGGKGTAGVAALIQQTPGAVGYLESGYAKIVDLPTAALENRAGRFVLPDEESILRALEEAKFDKVYAATVPDPKGDHAYPIVTFTWVLCRKRYASARVAGRLREVLRYCLTDGQKLSNDLGYVPLPKKLVPELLKMVERIEPRGGGNE